MFSIPSTMNEALQPALRDPAGGAATPPVSSPASSGVPPYGRPADGGQEAMDAKRPWRGPRVRVPGEERFF